MKRIALALFGLLLMSLPMWGANSADAAGCLFFTETAGGQGGYSVCDDEQANFRTAFETWGLQKIGYPISRRYMRDGFVTQAFQKAIMQWRPDGNYVALVNVFDDLHNDNFDEQLLAMRQTPKQFPAGWDGEGLSFPEVVAKRQAVLDMRPALRSAYFAASDPLTFYGLPTSDIQDMDNHYAVRLQRAVLQEWKEDVPWAAKGEVTIANGGDIAKELGGLPAEALVPEANAPAATEPTATSAPAATSEPTATSVPEATSEPTAAPQPTSEPVAPQPQPEPESLRYICKENPDPNTAPNSPVQILTVIKDGQPERVRLVNISSNTVDLTGWKMCSIRGNQQHDGISGLLTPGQIKEFPYTGTGHIWNNDFEDDGALYDATGKLVSYWVDSDN